MSRRADKAERNPPALNAVECGADARDPMVVHQRLLDRGVMTAGYAENVPPVYLIRFQQVWFSQRRRLACNRMEQARRLRYVFLNRATLAWYCNIGFLQVHLSPGKAHGYWLAGRLTHAKSLNQLGLRQRLVDSAALYPPYQSWVS